MAARVALIFIGLASSAVGAGFLIAGISHWLALQFGSVTAEFIVGGFLLAAGGLIMAVILVRPRHQPAQNQPAYDGEIAAALSGLPKHLLNGLGAEDLRGLALICQRRPLLAAAVALALGLGVGLDFRRRHRR